MRHWLNMWNCYAVLQEMLNALKAEYGYSDENAFLVLKDILAQIWNRAFQKET